MTPPSETDNVYLKDAQQGEYHLNGVTAELNASLMGLLEAPPPWPEFIDGIGASNSRNVALTNLSYLQLYLRVAKGRSTLPTAAKLKADPVWRRYVLVQFLRTAYWTAQSDRWAARLGSDRCRPWSDACTPARTAPSLKTPAATPCHHGR